MFRLFHAKKRKNCFYLSERTIGRVEADGERPDGRPQISPMSGARTRRNASHKRRRPLILPTFAVSNVSLSSSWLSINTKTTELLASQISLTRQ